MASRPRKLWRIAQDIKEDWGAKTSPHAAPYISAMATLETIDDMYYMDSAKTIVAYFLSNANGWKGDKARAVKAELKALLG